ncbi:arginase family protein [Actinoplanes sp. Pm04-4]|uniref:Arginase family protein n=1 Tax=Paractinoplanes pyxinae TaxID=2997416 RepID=A0ABT4AYF6_9ACTN|nr:arginase family protein [Actinoplanes pyxinae]MCY1139277.1 arginase family protein [Actinoplanes pyxinae]
MTTILVPYHGNERFPDDTIPVRPDVTVDPELEGDDWEQLARLNNATAEAVAAAGDRPLVFSGDCLIAGGVVAGLQRAGVDPAIVWFDGHGDVHTLETTTSGYLGGLSLRLVNGAHPELYADRIGLRPIAPERAVLADARDLDPAEAAYLLTSATRRLTVPEVDPDTVPPGPLLVHVDADVLDADELPGLRFPVPGGPSTGDLLAACERLLATGRVAALHVACTWHSPASALHAELLRALAG